MRVRRLSCRLFATVLREESSPPVPTLSAKEAELVDCKRYADGLQRSETDTAPEAGSGNEKERTFTSPDDPQQGEQSWKAPRDEDRTEQNPPANREKAGTETKDSEWENLDGMPDEEPQWHTLSPETKHLIRDLLDRMTEPEEEPSAFSEEQRRDLREPDF